MFKDSFKYYKAKSPIPDFKDVLDFDLPSEQVCELDLGTWNDETPRPLPFGLQPTNNWHCYTLPQHRGIIVIRNPFSVWGQRYWIARCLRDYPRKPNVTNLSGQLFSQSVLDDWWREWLNCDDTDEARRMKISMRWATLGYHHDWNNKVYSEGMRGEFPEDLGQLCDYFARALGFGKFTAQAAIVNYYPLGTTLAGHTDHSEVNLQAPLFSFSFGQTAIFLIGGKTKDEKPTALYLKSGDVLVMSGESRLCYHAVPRVMKAKNELWNDILPKPAENGLTSHCVKKLRIDYNGIPFDRGVDMLLTRQVVDEIFWTPYKNYLNDSRININVRQVLNDGNDSLQGL